MPPNELPGDWLTARNRSPGHPTDQHHPDLIALLRVEMLQAPEQRICFADYMERVLYQPDFGYYSTRAHQMGKAGDFFTSVHLGADFAQLLAVQFTQMWQVLGQPTPFTLVEMGAGQGLLAADILAYLQTQQPDLFAALTYVIVEKVPALIAAQQQQVHAWLHKIQWCDLTELPPNSVTGCFFSNELVDAFPVHQVVINHGELQEVYVQLNSDGKTGYPWQEVWGELSTPRLADYFQNANLTLGTYPQGYRTEVNLQALSWLQSVASRLQRGYLLTIDYGYPYTEQYYSPARHQGTLQCYFQHSRNSDPYANIGNQDITSHVDFGTLIQAGTELGLDTLGLTQQGVFLMNLGLGDRLSRNNQAPGGNVNTILQRRDALHQLINPHGLGGFPVLVQSKGLTGTEKVILLRGLENTGELFGK
jgi:SAM-dependent MidA family methyltransferase